MERAAQLLGKVDALMKEKSSCQLPPNQLEDEHSVTPARASLGGGQFGAARETGHELIISKANLST